MIAGWLGIATAIVTPLFLLWSFLGQTFQSRRRFLPGFDSLLSALPPLLYEDDILHQLPLLNLPLYRGRRRRELGIVFKPKWRSAAPVRGGAPAQGLKSQDVMAPPSALPPHLVALLFNPFGWQAAQLAQLVSLAQCGELQVKERMSSRGCQLEASVQAGASSEIASLYRMWNSTKPVCWDFEAIRSRHNLETELIGFPSKWRTGLRLGAVGMLLIGGCAAVKPAYLPFLIAALSIVALALVLSPIQRIFPLWHIERMRWLEFRNYLCEARSRQNQSDAGELFARYLPYAIALGVVSEWAQQFADVPLRKPTWWKWGWVILSQHLPHRREVSRRLGWALLEIGNMSWEPFGFSHPFVMVGSAPLVIQGPDVVMEQKRSRILTSLATPQSVDWEDEIRLLERYEKSIRDDANDPDTHAEVFVTLGQFCEGFLLRVDRALYYYRLAYKSVPEAQTLSLALELSLAAGNIDAIMELLAVAISEHFYPERREQVHAQAGAIWLDTEFRDRARSHLWKMKSSDPRWPIELDEIDGLLGAAEFSGEDWQATVTQLLDEARAAQSLGTSVAARLWFQAARIFDMRDRSDPRYEECLRAIFTLQPQHRLGNMLVENWLAEQRRFDELESIQHWRCDQLADEQQRLRQLGHFGSMWLVRWKNRARACRFLIKALNIVYCGQTAAMKAFPGHVRAFCLLREELGPKGGGASVLALAEPARHARMSNEERGALMGQAALVASENMRDDVLAKLFLKEARRLVPDPD